MSSDTFIAKAACEYGTIYTLSSISTFTIEQVAEHVRSFIDPNTNRNPYLWFQLYVFRDRAVTKELISRAERSGYSAIVVTVDAPVSGKRERDLYNYFKYPDGLVPGNFTELFKRHKDSRFTSVSEYVISLYDPTLSWEDVKWLKKVTNLPIIIKGILSPEDALKAKDYNGTINIEQRIIYKI